MPSSDTMSAFINVLAEPVSTSTFGTSTEEPPWTSVTVMNGSSSRSVRRIVLPDADPGPFFDLQLGHAGMHEAQLASNVLLS